MTRSLWVDRSPYASNCRRILRELTASFGRLGIRDYLVEASVHIVHPPYGVPQTGTRYEVYMRVRKTPTGPDCHVRRWIVRRDRAYYSYGRKYRWCFFENASDVVNRSVGCTLKSMVALCRDAATGAM